MENQVCDGSEKYDKAMFLFEDKETENGENIVNLSIGGDNNEENESNLLEDSLLNRDSDYFENRDESMTLDDDIDLNDQLNEESIILNIDELGANDPLSKTVLLNPVENSLFLEDQNPKGQKIAGKSKEKNGGFFLLSDSLLNDSEQKTGADFLNKTFIFNFDSFKYNKLLRKKKSKNTNNSSILKYFSSSINRQHTNGGDSFDSSKERFLSTNLNNSKIWKNNQNLSQLPQVEIKDEENEDREKHWESRQHMSSGSLGDNHLYMKGSGCCFQDFNPFNTTDISSHKHKKNNDQFTSTKIKENNTINDNFTLNTPPNLQQHIPFMTNSASNIYITSTPQYFTGQLYYNPLQQFQMNPYLFYNPYQNQTQNQGNLNISNGNIINNCRGSCDINAINANMMRNKDYISKSDVFSNMNDMIKINRSNINNINNISGINPLHNYNNFCPQQYARHDQILNNNFSNMPNVSKMSNMNNINNSNNINNMNNMNNLNHMSDFILQNQSQMPINITNTFINININNSNDTKKEENPEENSVKKNNKNKNIIDDDDEEKRIKYEIDVEKIRKHEEKRTTIRIKNIPITYGLGEIADLLNNSLGVNVEGHNRPYNLIYLPPSKKSGKNIGYVFINMVSPIHVMNLYEKISGKVLTKTKPCVITFAKIQGKEKFFAEHKNEKCQPQLFDDTENADELLVKMEGNKEKNEENINDVNDILIDI